MPNPYMFMNYGILSPKGGVPKLYIIQSHIGGEEGVRSGSFRQGLKIKCITPDENYARNVLKREFKRITSRRGGIRARLWEKGTYIKTFLPTNPEDIGYYLEEYQFPYAYEGMWWLRLIIIDPEIIEESETLRGEEALSLSWLKSVLEDA